jgi:hypothetical protein
MSTFQYILLGGLALIGLYLAARLITAAYFQSKHYYDNQRTERHG